MTYRRDVDGLRAIAVLSVVIFHLGIPFQFDGFVGVDIFFVISGFLITGILFKDIAAGSFSLAGFYLRRIKRILPALYAVVFFTTIFGMMVMLPSDIKDLGKAAFSAVASASNIYFWFSEDASYFARSSELKPLLHTWSLGVEEQFYLVWPLLMLACYRIGRFAALIVVALAIAIASYFYAETLLVSDQSFSYYMLPTRAGELLIGALALFATQMKWEVKSILLIEGCGLLGASLIIYALFFANASASFPGFSAIAPCVGAALLLSSGAIRRTLVARALGSAPMVAVGLVSYSLYLWHWPVLAYARYLYVHLTPVLILNCVLLMSALSVLSYRFIETPFRARAVGPKFVFWAYLVAPAALLIPLTLYLYVSNGLEEAITGGEQYRTLSEETDTTAKPSFLYDFVCQRQQQLHDDSTLTGKKCVVGAKRTDPSILLWGDSHAAHHVGFVAQLALHHGLAARNLEVGSCPPVFANPIPYVKGEVGENCAIFRHTIESEMLKYDTIILAAAWNSYFYHPQFSADVLATIEELLRADKKVVLLGQIPKFRNYDRNCRLRNERFFDIECEQLGQNHVQNNFAANEYLKAIARDRVNVTYFDLSEQICSDGCSPYFNGQAGYSDPGHLSIYTSSNIGKRHAAELGRLLGR